MSEEENEIKSNEEKKKRKRVEDDDEEEEEKDLEEKKKAKIAKTSKIIIVPYSEFSIAIFGDTKAIKDSLKSEGGKYNGSLRNMASNGERQPGWIFAIKLKDQVMKMITAQTGSAPIYQEVEYPPKAEKDTSTGTATATDATSTSKSSSGVYIVQYSEKSIAVFGDTKAIKDQLKGLGGRFNGKLKDSTKGDVSSPGWIFSNSQKEVLQKLIAK